MTHAKNRNAYTPKLKLDDALAILLLGFATSEHKLANTSYLRG